MNTRRGEVTAQKENTMGRILVLEDNLDINTMLCDVLKVDGHTCFSAQTVGQAETIVSEESLDLALLDMNLPGGTGLDILSQIRNSPDHTNTSTIVLTANPLFQAEAETLGADFFMVKPLRIDTLRTLVKRCLQSE